MSHGGARTLMRIGGLSGAGFLACDVTNPEWAPFTGWKAGATLWTRDLTIGGSMVRIPPESHAPAKDGGLPGCTFHLSVGAAAHEIAFRAQAL